MIFREPTYKAPQAPDLKEVSAIYEKRALEKGKETRVPDDPLAGPELPLTSGAEYLNSIVLVGDTALGIVQTHDTQHKVSLVRLVVLPVGDKAGMLGKKQSSGTLARIDTSSLRDARAGGVVKPWETVAVGRKDIAALTGVTDEFISGNHLALTVKAEGTVLITDNSSNGTRMITASDLMRSEEAGGLKAEDKERIAEFLKPFEDRHYMWEESASGKQVINPQQ